MELYQLRSFVRVARLGNLTRAASEINLTQPAVSSQIRLLEDEVGERLFERKGRGLLLTQAGSTLLARAEQMLAIEERAKEEIASIAGVVTGSVRIGTNDSNCLYVLPDVISEFRGSHPGVTIHIENGHSTLVASWVAEGRVEIGIVTLPIASADLVSMPLYEREDVLVCPPDHELATADAITPGLLAAHPLLMLHGGSVSHRRLSAALEEANATPQRVMRVGSVEVIKAFVLLGLGVAVVPSLNVTHDVAEGRLVAKSLDWLPRLSVGVIARRTGYLSPAAKAFVQRLELSFPVANSQLLW